MTESAKALRREYKRKWAAEHKELCRGYQEKYWEKKALENAEKHTDK